MVVEDSDLIGVNENRLPDLTQHFIRVVPEISLEFTNPKALALKAEFAKEISDLAAPIDDPIYVLLHGKYINAILYDFETRSSAKLFRIASIQFVRSYTDTRVDCWEATCEPVFRNSKSGQFAVPQDAMVVGSNVTMKHALQGYALAEYRDGTDAEPTYLPWVDQYISHFRNSILPKYASLFLDSPSTGERDLPSSARKDLPSSARKDLPSSARKDLPSSTRKDLPSSARKSSRQRQRRMESSNW